MIEAIRAVAQTDVPRETFTQLERYVALLLAANETQNLISRSTAGEIWRRHILDSAQLVRFAPSPASAWLDIGSGAGLPGLVITLLTRGPMTLVEPRRLRANFLAEAVAQLELRERVQVIPTRVENVADRFDVITARAFAAIDRIFAVSLPLAHPATKWVLPRGRSGKSELAEACRTWQGEFRTEPSRTDSDAVIVLASGVSMRGRK